METARLKIQGGYSLLAGIVLLIVIPVYQATVLAPAGYQAPAAAAFSQGNYGPLLEWIGTHSTEFLIFRLLELSAFLLIWRLPLALARALRGYGQTLARWTLVCGTGGVAIFGGLLALSTVTFFNTASEYSQAATGSTTANDILTSFNGLYGAEALGQNSLGGALIAIFLLCSSLLIARSGKLSSLLVYFGLLAAALLAGLALLYAISPPDAQTQMTTPALLAFAIWLIWLGILLLRRAARLITPAVVVTAPTPADAGAALPGIGSTREDAGSTGGAKSTQVSSEDA